MMDSGLTIKLREKESISIRMELLTLDNGKMINNMDMVKKNGLMEPGTRAALLKDSNKDTEDSSGETTANTKASSKTTTSKDSDTINGLTAENTKANGKTTKCMESGISSGQTVDSTKAATSMIEKKDKGSSSGLTEEAIKETGKMESKTVEESIPTKQVSKSMEPGLMAKNLNGIIDIEHSTFLSNSRFSSYQYFKFAKSVQIK